MESTASKRKKTNRTLDSRKRRKEEEPIKVVHFSDPIHVYTTPCEFKWRVQELTGRSSTVADVMFSSNDAGGWRELLGCVEEAKNIPPLDLGPIAGEEEDELLAPWESLFADCLWPLDAV